MTHTVTVQYRCGHEWKFHRVPGGVTDPSNCNCEACQPWDGIAKSQNDCRACGGTGMYLICDVKPVEAT